MAERYELLDAAIQAILDGATEVAIPRELEALVSIAADLRDLPRPEFKRRLRGGNMSRVTDVIPYLVAEDVDGLIDFVKRAFEMEEVFRTTGSAGGTHCEVRLRGQRLMIGGGLEGRSNRGAIMVVVPDVDAAHRRAVEAGATSLREPADQEYGARDSSLRDAFGNEWYISSAGRHGDQVLIPWFHPPVTQELIDFLQSALGGEVVETTGPDDPIHYAKVRLGETLVEMGAARGEWQPIPMMLMARVDDVDAAYARAMAAGAKSISEPNDVGHGRSGAVEDPFGNQWYLTRER